MSAATAAFRSDGWLQVESALSSNPAVWSVSMQLLEIPTRFAGAARRGRKAGWIGVDIGTRSIKIAQLEMRNERLRLASHVVIVNQDNHRLDEQSVASGWITQAVRNGLSARGGFHGKRAACTLSMSATELRTLELPAGSDVDRESLVAGELGVPGQFEFDYWDFPPAPDVDAPRRREVLIVAVTRSLSDLVADSLLDAGLVCEVMDGLPFAISRSAALPSEPNLERPVAILDWGESTATMAIVQNGCPLYVRRFRESGLHRLNKAVRDSFEVTHQECGLLLSTYGLPVGSAQRSGETGELQQMLGQTVSEPVHQVAHEVQRTLLYLQTQRPDLLPDRLWLCGGGAAIRNIADNLAGRIRLPVEIWHPGPWFDRTDAPIPLLASAVSLSQLAWHR